MAVKGYIALHRKLLDNPIICKDSDYLAVWIYLLLNATHSEYEELFEGHRITLQKGQLITGRKSISEKLKISESKVTRILKSFEIEQQIEQQTSSKNRLITVVNWCLYQRSEQQIEQQVNNNRTTSEQQVNTYNNDNKNNNENNDNKKDKDDVGTNVHDDACIRVSKYLLEKVKQIQRNMHEPNINSWAKHIDLLIRLDKYTENEIIEVIDWALSDKFWSSNIRSTSKLREKFETLSSQMKSPKRANDREDVLPVFYTEQPSTVTEEEKEKLKERLKALGK